MPNPPPRAKPNAQTTLTANHTSGGTSLTVADATLLPTAPYYILVFDAAGTGNTVTFRVTTVVSNTLTVAIPSGYSDANLNSGASVTNHIAAAGEEDIYLHATTHAHTGSDNSAALATDWSVAFLGMGA